MADNYLEYARESYEKRKQAWQAKQKRHTPASIAKRKPKI